MGRLLQSSLLEIKKLVVKGADPSKIEMVILPEGVTPPSYWREAWEIRGTYEGKSKAVGKARIAKTDEKVAITWRE